MNQAEVRYDKKRIKLSEILEAIQKAGFKGHLHVEKTIEKEKRSYEKLHVYGTLVLAFSSYISVCPICWEVLNCLCQTLFLIRRIPLISQVSNLC